jgi:hypothetical protein
LTKNCLPNILHTSLLNGFFNVNNKLIASGLIALAALGFGASQASANSIIKANLTLELNKEKYSGLQVGTYEADALGTQDTSEARFKFGGDLSSFGKRICESFAAKEGKPMTASSTPGTVGVIQHDSGMQTYQGRMDYRIGTPVINSQLTASTGCVVEYTINVDTDGSLKSDSRFSVSMNEYFTTPLGVDQMSGTITGGMAPTWGARAAYFTVTGVEIVE